MTFRDILYYKISLLWSNGSRAVLYVEMEGQMGVLSEKHAFLRAAEKPKIIKSICMNPDA
jgi:hypothetical protein